MTAASNLPYENRSALILKYLGENDSISVETVMDLCHVSASTARSHLAKAPSPDCPRIADAVKSERINEAK